MCAIEQTMCAERSTLQGLSIAAGALRVQRANPHPMAPEPAGRKGISNGGRARPSGGRVEAQASARVALSGSNFAGIATDCNGLIQFFNQGAERLLGFAAAELMYRCSIERVLDTDELTLRARSLQARLGLDVGSAFVALTACAALPPHAEDVYELTFVRHDGVRIPVVVSVAALLDPEGGIIGFLLIGADNTERKQAETALVKATALQNAICSSVHFSSIATDAAGVIQIFNAGAERLLGYDAAEVIGRFTPADLHDADELVVRAAELSVEFGVPIEVGFEALVYKASRGIADIYELTKVRKDGTRFSAIVSVTALRGPDKEIIGYLLIGNDNTERKNQELALAKAAALQCAIANSAFFSMIATDESGLIQILNAGAQRMLGYSAQEAIGKLTPADLHDPEEIIARAGAISEEFGAVIAPGFEALVFKARRGIADMYRLTKIRKDGTRFPAIVSVTGLRDIDDRVIGYLLIGTDNSLLG
jgi:PAS domain S-box-containing protein